MSDGEAPNVLVIAGLDLLFALLGEMEDLSESYHLSDALLFVAMTSPRQLYEVTPYCLLIGVLIAVGIGYVKRLWQTRAAAGK